MIDTLTGVVRDNTGSASAQSVQPLTIPEGEHSVLTLTVYREDGAAFNLTGYEVWLCARKNSATAAIINKQGSLLVPANGTATITLTNADTDSLAGTYRYDVWLVETATQKSYRVIPVSAFIVDDSMFDQDDLP